MTLRNNLLACLVGLGIGKQFVPAVSRAPAPAPAGAGDWTEF